MYSYIYSIIIYIPFLIKKLLRHKLYLIQITHMLLEAFIVVSGIIGLAWSYHNVSKLK